LLKGAALAGTVYQDIGLRPMGDLDILVPEHQVHVAQEAIQSLGFDPAGTTGGHHRHLPRLQRQGTAAQVEVHRHIVNRDTTLYFDIQGFWCRAQEVLVARSRVRVLAPEDLLIHLCVNFFQDRRFKSTVALRQLCDIGESLKFHQDSIRWPIFLENVVAYHLTGPVGCVLYLAQQLLDAPLPEEVAQQLWPKGFDELPMERFARRRVLDTQNWVTHALVGPDKHYNLRSVAAAVIRRLFLSRRMSDQRYQRPAPGVTGFLMYLALIANNALIACRSAMRLDKVREDLAIDRWHHSMYQSRNGPRKK
jgi:hypothetical protein